MEDIPTLYALPLSSHTRVYPHRPAFKTYMKAPCNSPASSIVSSQFASVRYARKQHHVRFADCEASAESASQTETALRTYYSVTQERSLSPHITTGISSIPKTSEHSVQYSKERDTCEVVQSVPASTLLPSSRPVVVQIDDCDTNKDIKSACNDDRIVVEYSQKFSTKEACVLGIQSRMKCNSCLKPYLLVSVAMKRGNKKEIMESNSTPKAHFFYKKIGLSRRHFHCPVRSPGCRVFCKTMSWLTTAVGLASYAYMLLLAYSSDEQLIEQRHLFPFAVALSNVCLGVALYCNCIL